VQQTLATQAVVDIKDLSEATIDDTEAATAYFTYLEQLHLMYDQKSNGELATAFLFEALNEEGERLLHLAITPPVIRGAKRVSHHQPPPVIDNEAIDPAAAAAAFGATKAGSAFHAILNKGDAVLAQERNTSRSFRTTAIDTTGKWSTLFFLQKTAAQNGVTVAAVQHFFIVLLCATSASKR
jgi:hypothetical protein